MLKAFFAFVGVVFLIYLIAGDSPSNTATDFSSAAPRSSLPPVVISDSQRIADKWMYRVDEDPMTSKTARYASIESENTVSFAFPYQGVQRATLTIRNHPSWGFDVYLQLTKGQILCRSYEDCSVMVRFDEREAQSWAAVGPGDNSTETVFLRSEPRFVERLRAAKVVRIQIPVYQEGAPTFEFHVGGFNYSRYRGTP